MSINFNDSLSVNRLLETSYQEILESEQFEKEFSQASGLFPESNQYVILTRSDNLVKNAEFLSSADEGFSYYLVTGIPQITLKFPWTELIIIILLIVIVIRLLFKKGEYELRKVNHHERDEIRESFGS